MKSTQQTAGEVTVNGEVLSCGTANGEGTQQALQSGKDNFNGEQNACIAINLTRHAEEFQAIGIDVHVAIHRSMLINSMEDHRRRRVNSLNSDTVMDAFQECIWGYREHACKHVIHAQNNHARSDLQIN